MGGDTELVLGGQVTLTSELVEHNLLFADLLLLIVCVVRKTQENRAGYSTHSWLGLSIAAAHLTRARLAAIVNIPFFHSMPKGAHFSLGSASGNS